MQLTTPDRFYRLIDQLQAHFLPRIDPELRASRTNLARSIVLAQYALLGLWVLGVLIFSSLNPQGQIVIDLAGIAFLAGAGALALWLLRKGLLNMAGYAISLSWFLVVSASAFLVPEYIVFISAAFFLPDIGIGGDHWRMGSISVRGRQHRSQYRSGAIRRRRRQGTSLCQ